MDMNREEINQYIFNKYCSNAVVNRLGINFPLIVMFMHTTASLKYVYQNDKDYAIEIRQKLEEFFKNEPMALDLIETMINWAFVEEYKPLPKIEISEKALRNINETLAKREPYAKAFENHSNIITAGELCEVWGISRAALHKKRCSKKFPKPILKEGVFVYYATEDIINFMVENEYNPCAN